MHHAIGLWRENQSLFIVTKCREAGFEQDSVIHPFRFIGQATKNGCPGYNFHCSEAEVGELALCAITSPWRQAAFRQAILL
jgi:hypothetical protein